MKTLTIAEIKNGFICSEPEEEEEVFQPDIPELIVYVAKWGKNAKTSETVIEGFSCPPVTSRSKSKRPKGR